MSESFIYCFPLTDEDTGNLTPEDVASVFKKLRIAATPTTPVTMNNGAMDYQLRNDQTVAVIAFAYVDPHVSPERRSALFELMRDRNVIALVLKSPRKENRIIIGANLRAYANARLVSGDLRSQRLRTSNPHDRPL